MHDTKGNVGQQSRPTQTPSIGLNTTTTVTVEQPAATPASTSTVRRASFEAVLPHATREIISPNNAFEPYEEKLSVKVTVPNTLLAASCKEAETLNAIEQFQQVSDRITAQIKSALPNNLLSKTLPVEVIPQHAIAAELPSNTLGVDFLAIQKFWPLWAILFTGIFTVIAFSSSNRSTQRNRESVREPDDERDIETQLSELIDSDPAAAAKVLKNWIQQEH